MIKLSILIPSLVSRAEQLNLLLFELDMQIAVNNLIDKVEVLVRIDDGELSIGDKRNALLAQATGEYIAFIDDDDMVSKDYLKFIFDKIMPDCCSLKGIIYFDGENPEIFEHSIKYPKWKTNEHLVNAGIKYERSINHLNVVRAELVKSVLFPSINHGEDRIWSKDIQDKIKTEAYIEYVLYYYKFKTKK